jgi:hypothetical protein
MIEFFKERFDLKEIFKKVEYPWSVDAYKDALKKAKDLEKQGTEAFGDLTSSELKNKRVLYDALRENISSWSMSPPTEGQLVFDGRTLKAWRVFAVDGHSINVKRTSDEVDRIQYEDYRWIVDLSDLKETLANPGKH